jgi:outer membrane protein OmpA-like peptidoglycan-associated protein
VVGAIIGNQGGNSRTGAVIGAAVGAGIGAAAGHNMDQQQKELQQIPGVEVSRPAENQIDVRLTSDILFDLNSADLRPASRDTLRDLAANFSRYPNEMFDIEGHTDSTGAYDYNMKLSQRRADSVAEYLVDHSVPRSQITTRGFGPDQPKATNDTPEGRQLNRRVEIHIHGKNT